LGVSKVRKVICFAPGAEPDEACFTVQALRATAAASVAASAADVFRMDAPFLSGPPRRGRDPGCEGNSKEN